MEIDRYIDRYGQDGIGRWIDLVKGETYRWDIDQDQDRDDRSCERGREGYIGTRGGGKGEGRVQNCVFLGGGEEGGGCI